MDHLFSIIAGLVVSLLGLIGAAIGVIEGAARHGLAALGISGEAQTLLLLLLLLLLIVAAFRVFGRVLAILIALALLILLLHAVIAPAGGVHV
ncbi:hypothetical protein NFI95_05310 [Acetobacteraceae bacterium KSS8]|uniref:Uncharacterized protein n=1 Tax=Endosaccharibacter trunci TaxID=2812733 RepID=A0ABT1W6S7_9PROT|nr:hypothetical protein [Acetobacteraceae bacterium KSS8]